MSLDLSNTKLVDLCFSKGLRIEIHFEQEILV